jgi:hypothetical protein
MDLTPAGIRFVWEATDPAGFCAARERLSRRLAADEDGERIGVLAQETEVPYPLAQALAQGWADEGLLRFEDGYSPPEAALVHSVAETFRRTIVHS